MRLLLLALLLALPLRAESPTEVLVARFTDMGAYVLVGKLAQADPAGLQAQSLQGMVKLPPERRWMLPSESLPVLLSVRLSLGPEALKVLDGQIAEAQSLKLDEQELALRVLALRVADHADLPGELLRRLPATLELAPRVGTPRGKLLAFQAASYDFIYTHNPRDPQAWQQGYAAASALLPRAGSVVPPNSFGLWHGFGECLYTWMIYGIAAGADKPYVDSMSPDVAMLTAAGGAGIKLNPAQVEPVLATLWLSMRTAAMDSSLLDGTWSLVQQLKPAYTGLEQQLTPQKLTCMDELSGLEAYYYLTRLSQNLDQGDELVVASEAVLRYGAPSGAVDLATIITHRALAAKKPDIAEQALQQYLLLPNLTRVERSTLLTQTARCKLALNKADEAKALAFEARTLQLEYLAERKASAELDKLLFDTTLDLMKELGMQ